MPTWLKNVFANIWPTYLYIQLWQCGSWYVVAGTIDAHGNEIWQTD